jgi:hypothetical protein
MTKTRIAVAVVGALGLLVGGMVVGRNDPAGLDAVLRDVVIEGKVDYAKLRAVHANAVDAFISEFKDVGAPEQPLADYLNLYNAVMLKAVLEKRAADPAWTPASGNFSVFKESRVPMKSGMQSLDHLEHQVIRKLYKEPRIHAVVNCAAASCPPLLSRAMRTEDLDTTLESAMRAFVNDPTRNRFDDTAKVMRLSRIFDWFNADFGGPAGVPDYISKYRPGNYKGWKVEFIEYDWTLNERK